MIQTTFLLFLEFHWKLQFSATNVMMVSNFQWSSKSVWIISRPRAEGLTVEDIYRSSGVKSKITKLKATYYSRQRQCVKLGSYEPIIVASLFKLFLRELLRWPDNTRKLQSTGLSEYNILVDAYKIQLKGRDIKSLVAREFVTDACFWRVQMCSEMDKTCRYLLLKSCVYSNTYKQKEVSSLVHSRG